MPNELANSGGPSSTTAAPTHSPSPASTPTHIPPVSKNPFAAKEAAASPEPATPSSQPPGEAGTPPSAGQQQQAQPQVQQPQAPVQQVLQVTPEQLAQAMRLQQQPAQQTQQAPAQQKMSDQEFRQRFNVFEATADDYTRLFGVAPDSPERVAALNGMLQQLSRQSVTMARHLFDAKLNEFAQKFEGEYGPIKQSFSEQREAHYKQQFFTKYPELQDHQPLLQEIVESARSRGMNFKTAEEAYEFVANTARKLLGPVAPQPGQRISQQAAQPAEQKMPTVSMGGRSGGSGGSQAPKSTAQMIFGRPNR